MDERMLNEKVMFKLISYVAEHTNKTTSEMNRKLQIDSVQGIERLIGKFGTFYEEYKCFQDKVLNKGAGAGGDQTNKNGKKWENDTCNKNRLISQGYTYKLGTLKKENDNHEISYFAQGDLKRYFKDKCNITIYRNPDEAYLINKRDGSSVLKILEKKFQNVEGSVEDKLLTGAQIKREYELFLQKQGVEVSYAYCLSPFLEKKIKSNKLKYNIWNQIFRENDITILFGENDDYYTKLDSWISSF